MFPLTGSGDGGLQAQISWGRWVKKSGGQKVGGVKKLRSKRSGTHKFEKKNFNHAYVQVGTCEGLGDDLVHEFVKFSSLIFDWGIKEPFQKT